MLNNINAGPIWQKNWGTSIGFMPAYDPTYGSGGTLFIGGGGGPTIGAVDPATGADRWAVGSVVAGGGGNMAVANGLIYTNDGSNGLRILDETNGNTLRTLVPAHAGDSNSGVVVANGIIYWLSGSYLNAWALPGNPVPTATPTSRCSGQRFSDVCPGDYFYDAVTYLSNHNVISGYSDGTFRPYNNATRGQLSKIVVLAENWPINTAGGPHFSDVQTSNRFLPLYRDGIPPQRHIRLLGRYFPPRKRCDQGADQQGRCAGSGMANQYQRWATLLRRADHQRIL